MNKFQLMAFILKNTKSMQKNYWSCYIHGQCIFNIIKNKYGYINTMLGITAHSNFMRAIASWVNKCDEGTIAKLAIIKNEMENVVALENKIADVKNAQAKSEYTLKVLADDICDELAVNLEYLPNGNIKWSLVNLWEATTFITWATGHDMRLKTGMNFQRMMDVLPLMEKDLLRRREVIRMIGNLL